MNNHDASPYIEPRRRLVRWLRTCLMGPGPKYDVESEKDILNGQRPTQFFPTGILFPITPGGAGIDRAAEPEDNEDGVASSDPDGEDQTAKPAGHSRRYIAPSAVGFSFYASRDIEFHVSAWGASYRSLSRARHQWQRIPLSQNNDRTSFAFPSPPSHQRIEFRHPLWMNADDVPRAEIFSLWRPYESGWLISISLCNRQQVCRADEILPPEEEKIRLEEMAFFEVELACAIDAGEIYPYPRKDPSLLDDEEIELELQYRRKKIFAIGHGAAVDWQLDAGRVDRLQTDFLPTAEVPLVTPDNAAIEPRTLALDFLSRTGTDPDVFTALEAFVQAYGQWLEDRQETVDHFEGSEKKAGERILGRILTARDRMAGGIDLLRRHPAMAEAFALTHAAMRSQWAQQDRIRDRAPRTYRWRPFQLGFLLLTIRSVADADCAERDIVDLIWFPTGGGKTEAYLALIAFQIIWRRMQFPTSGGGTAVIMRYTLRLLTQQQFERAARLICALEILRQRRPERLGREPITAGMWVGSATTPNTFKDAMAEIRKASPDQAPRRFVFTRCPWCGGRLWCPGEHATRHGFHATDARFQIRCLNRENCAFGSRDPGALPLNVVDEALYADPPTLLFATVDKLARLAWDPRTVAFFGHGACRPPELIVQDELHLIAGALGSIVGIYEAALDAVLVQRGIYPKYIASTATIRNARTQIQKLFGRRHAVFPPPGIDADDSFFTRALPVDRHPGRLYLGYLASILKKGEAFAALTAALFGAPDATGMDTPALSDAWRTLIAYHGSLRGVGDSHNALAYRTKSYREAQHQLKWYVRHDPSEEVSSEDSGRPQNAPRVAQLTSHYSPEENARTFGRLACPAGESECLDAVLATNMISVGLDVDRLALMIINGQPLTTAEYIQASSRVGRSEVPGLVVANYYRWQARSLSHYENFRPYHESFYRFVEPTSVTPFTPQVRRRALHAALVIVMRLSIDDLRENGAAGAFDPSRAVIQKALEILKRRCRQADPDQAEQTDGQLDALAGDWGRFADACRKQETRLVYQRPANDRSAEALLYAHQDVKHGKWATLNSMRNVEESGLLRATKSFAPPEKEGA
ncbi:hypothetical protein DSCO28_51110 [Desulfosarcina ovata subsp. sediminis]|uniref:Helicase C-terminal domain-containing protein n=1 Tax=Desulfosarcina ovata subsp. sediminis TaxID=885957 RepID=A0A5K7ZWB1_9BACT|nr:helicase-related protein [Desulfosarcina ovata]BBO84545.1 hypothetical protein DSCO28_51110 [Desulfosarcina ovata subsp. sediminis]